MIMVGGAILATSMLLMLLLPLLLLLLLLTQVKGQISDMDICIGGEESQEAE